MVTQVMNAFCHLPGSQSLLTMSQSSGSGVDKSLGEEEGKTLGSASQSHVPLKQSVASFTNSIVALTSSIVKNDEGKTASATSLEAKGKAGEENAPDPRCLSKQENGAALAPPDLGASVTSLTSNDLNSTGQDVSTLSNDSNEGGDASHRHDREEDAPLSDSSRSSLSPSPPGLTHTNGASQPPHYPQQQQQRPSGPPRPSTLPVARPLTPRTNS